MVRTRAHAARLTGLSDGRRNGKQNILLHFLPHSTGERHAIALSLDDACRLYVGLAALLPEVIVRLDESTETN